MKIILKSFIIVDKEDALDIDMINKMDAVIHCEMLPSGQYLYDFWNEDLTKLSIYQLENKNEYSQRMIDDLDFKNYCLKQIKTRNILTSIGSENFNKKYYTYSDNILGVRYSYHSFKKYMHQIFVEESKLTSIKFEYARMKKKIDVLLSWISDINIDYKIEKYDSKIEIILGDIKSIDWAMIMVFLMNVRINKRVDFSLNVDHKDWC